jgi:hypothetical protein
MADTSAFVARDLVRTYSNTLNGSQSGKSSSESPQERLESALKEEVEREDALASLIQNAASRFVLVVFGDILDEADEYTQSQRFCHAQ